MTIRVSKPEFNLREKLSELDYSQVPFQKMPSGSIIQVGYAQTKTQQSMSSNSWTNASDMFVDISPRFASSKMLITVHTVSQLTGNRVRFDIHKSTTNSRISDHANDNGVNYGISAFEGANINHVVSFTIRDTANTTENIRYQLQWINTGGNQSFIQAGYSVGTITVMEIKE